MRPVSLIPLLFVLCTAHGQAWTFTGDTTATWEQAIAHYERLDAAHDGAQLLRIGTDDDGSPIHLFVITDGAPLDPAGIRAEGRNILWITNAIHAGEPDGVDASLMLAQALLEDDHLMGLTARTVVCIVPMYNVSGARQRERPSRPDQNGPVEHGIRANAKNYDLNRDFIKMDAENTRGMVGALADWDPDVYFETHVSDGADHQYVMELLMTQKDKLDPGLSAFTTGVVVPGLYEWMDRKGQMMCPYFETVKDAPDDGLVEFHDAPRYSTGYNALFDRIGILAESHMLKPYADRVNATFQLMLATLAVMDRHPDELRTARTRAKEATSSCASFGLNWRLDTTQVEELLFKGYASSMPAGLVSGLPQVKYDRNRPVDLLVPWFGRYVPTLTVEKPKAYLVPRAWKEVIERLALNDVPINDPMPWGIDTVEVAHVISLGSPPTPYEGHYVHRDVMCEWSGARLPSVAPYVLVPMGHPTDRFVMSVLEPECSDSYFAWNFFDAILQQKEGFNDYSFDAMAAELLKDRALRSAFQEKRANDPAFAADPWEQLNFVFQRSPWSETAYHRYPVLRVMP